MTPHDWSQPPLGWDILHTPTPTSGLCIYATRKIHIDPHLPAHVERCVLAHEIVHAERGPFLRRHTAREEEAVSREAARRLIPWESLLDVATWAATPGEAAEDLNVDLPTLAARLRSLTQQQHDTITKAREDHAHGGL